MRFTASQTSFKSGRLSPKLYNRIDTKQYKDGASELSGVRPIVEGGVTRIKGSRYRNTSIPESMYEDCKMLSISVKGTPIMVLISRYTSTNEVLIWTAKYPYAYADVHNTTIIQAGSTEYDPQLFDYTVLPTGEMILTHFSGTMIPIVITFSSAADGSFTLNRICDVYNMGPYNANDATTGTGNLSNSRFRPPMEPYTTYPLLITRYTADTGSQRIALNGTGAGVTPVETILKRSMMIYAEGTCSKNYTGDGLPAFVFMVSGFYFPFVNTAAPYGTTGVWSYCQDFYTNAGALEGCPFTAFNDNLSAGHLNGTPSTWYASMWYTGNWPRTVTSYEGRVIFGGTPSHPLALFGSEVGNPYNYCQVRKVASGNVHLPVCPPFGDITVKDPFVFTISSKVDSRISFLAAAKVLAIGTDRTEYIASGGDTILSPLSVSIKPVSSNGSLPLSSASTGESIAYLAQNGHKVFQLKYSDENGSYVSQQLSVLFSDLLDNDYITQMVWAPHIQSLLLVTGLGYLYGLVNDPEHDTIAFYKTGQTKVFGVAYVDTSDQPGTDPGLGDHALLVQGDSDFSREIGLVSYEQSNIEGYGFSEGLTAAIAETNILPFLDRVIKVSFSSGPSAGNFTYTYNGESVVVPYGYTTKKFPIPVAPFGSSTYVWVVPVAQTHSPQRVLLDVSGISGGIFQWDTPAADSGVSWSSCWIGAELPDAQIATMPIEAGQQWGTAQMGIKNIDTLSIRHYNTYSYEISSDGTTWEEVVVADDTGLPTTARTERKFTSNPKYDQIVFIRQTNPEPLTIVGINMRGISNDG